MYELIDRLATSHSLELQEYECLINAFNVDYAQYIAYKADKVRRSIYGTDVYIRGLIEVSNVCRNDCYYCGIRRSNANCERYILDTDSIMRCCAEGYELGFRTFVLQGGEGSFKNICETVANIRNSYKDCAITLSFGEYSRAEYQKMYEAGADRYLLRHETADEVHYNRLHPKSLSFQNRMRCLQDLKSIGFQTGCGFMVGSPYQTSLNLAKDLKFIEEFQPQMCGVGPFIPHHDTQFAGFKAGSVDLTIYLLSIIRLIKPNILLPATTALGTLSPDGRERAIKAGANVIMPNLSPYDNRSKYTLYDNKLATGKESAQNLMLLKKSMENIGYNIVVAKGDIKTICQKENSD